MRNKSWMIAGVTILVLVGGTLFYAFNRSSSRTSFFNEAVFDQVSYTLLQPENFDDKQQATIKYDASQNNVSYVQPYEDKAYIVSMQQLPTEFVNERAYLEYVDKQDRIDKFESSVGTVYVIRPASFAGTEAVTLRLQDTLVFVRATEANVETPWEQIIETIAHPVN